MNETTFLDKIAMVILETNKENLSDLVVVLPNKRAKVFLIEALRNKVENTIFSPEIISIEDFGKKVDWDIPLLEGYKYEFLEI
ncbi:MAG: hypothetical protein EOO07_38395 [Chitinophagaceae bacterium]|nr:MAG: hypothetical protein EOO07_38395 [Chitinophagaceae bacterium]